jgi:hypothetical protein
MPMIEQQQTPDGPPHPQDTDINVRDTQVELAWQIAGSEVLIEEPQDERVVMLR